MYMFFTVLFIVELLLSFNYKPYNANFCIVQFDPTIVTPDLLLANVRDKTTFLKQFHENAIVNESLARYSMLINKSYAVKHNYPYFISNGMEYADFLQSCKHYNTSWLKLKFVHDIQYHNDECKWIFYLDSNSYFWMNGHDESLDHLIDGLSIHETTEAYKGVQKMILDDFKISAALDELGIAFLVGLDGVNHADGPGKAYPVMSKFLDFVGGTMFLVKNDKVGRKIIRDWLFQPKETEYVNHMYEHYGSHGKMATTILNRLIIPKYQKQTAFLSFKDTQFQGGSIIRRVPLSALQNAAAELELNSKNPRNNDS